MAERVFCIDFGSAFTKVALRRDPGADSRLLGRHGRVGEADFCIPSAVAVDRRGARPVPEFGDRAADLQSGNGIEVYRNWKKSIFLTPAAARPQQSPLEALLQSDELRGLATKYGVAAGQVTYLQQLVGAAKSLIAGPGGRVISAETQQQTMAASIAPHFFHWLRQEVLEECNRLPATGLKYEAIPVRVTVPAFAHGKGGEDHPGCKILTDALAKVGWPVHPEQPVVAEPYANAIGVLTKGSNALHRSRVHLGNMFGKGPLITVLKDAARHPSYRGVVIDVGAFTTDFAALTLKPQGEAVSDPDVAFTLRQHSVPIGISNLDAKLMDELPKEKADWLRRARSLDWEDFRRTVYTDGKTFGTNAVGKIGAGIEADMVRACLADFGQQLAVETAKFLDPLEPAALQELILTGGGSFIPAVRTTLQSAAQAGGRSFVKTHAPGLKKSAGGPPVDKLDETFARGGTAIGGASVYFEKDFY
jgi:hypothetical protein